MCQCDLTLHDLVNDPGELENIAHREHAAPDPALVEHMLAKLHELISRELSEEKPPLDLDLFGTREVTYPVEEA